jgi:glucosamine kinase
MNNNNGDVQLLIADSGSTKTDWAWISEEGEVTNIKTVGLNPYFTSSEEFIRILSEEVLPLQTSSGEFAVFFYGAGCGSQQNSEWVRNQLLSKGAVSVEVGTDLLGSGRSVFQDETGIIAILGTGANAGYYEKGEIIKSAPSLGYILGDEGSGVWIGKQMITAYLRHELPEIISGKVDDIFGTNREIILNRIYIKPYPNRYIASVASILNDFKNDPWTIKTMKDGFRLFFVNYIGPLAKGNQMKICIIGSVASLFSDILKEVAGEFGFNNLVAQSNVISGLVKYHQSHK